MDFEYQYVPDTQDDVDESEGAPILDIPQRKIIAIEHPCVLINLDKGLDTFGMDPDFQKVYTPLF